MIDRARRASRSRSSSSATRTRSSSSSAQNPPSTPVPARSGSRRLRRRRDRAHPRARAREPGAPPGAQGDPPLRGRRPDCSRPPTSTRCGRRSRGALEPIAPGRSLPLCYFRAPAMDYELPVYEHGLALVCPVLGGPKPEGARPRRHPRLRSAATWSRRATCGRRTRCRGARAPSARPAPRRRPQPCFRSPRTSRSSGSPPSRASRPRARWSACVGHAAELGGASAAAGRRAARARTPPSAAPTSLALLRYLAAELGRAGSGLDPWTSTPPTSGPEIWAAAEARTEDAGAGSSRTSRDGESTRLELASAAHAARAIVAVRARGRGISVFLAADEDALADARRPLTSPAPTSCASRRRCDPRASACAAAPSSFDLGLESGHETEEVQARMELALIIGGSVALAALILSPSSSGRTSTRRSGRTRC